MSASLLAEQPPSLLLPYSPIAESAFDLTTYWGRVQHFKRLVNQRNFLYTHAELEEYKALLQDFEKRAASGAQVTTPAENARLWHARYVLLGNYHPETNEPINRLFRTSGYCLVSLPIIIGFAFVPPTPLSQVFTQTLNQSFNFAYNFYNGNASNKYSPKELAFSYSMAVIASIVGSVGSLKLINRLRAAESVKNVLSRLAPYLGIVVANEVNLFFSRLQDFNRGIKVYDPETMQPLANEQTSIEAAKIAFQQTAVSRALIPASIFVFPYMYTYACQKLNFRIKNRVADIVVKSVVGASSLYVGLTYALAIFPQITRVPANRLEAQFRNLQRSDGRPIDVVAFNRGL